MKRGHASWLIGFALLLTAALVGSVALFAFALGLLVVVAGCLAMTRLGARRVAIARTVDQAEVVEGLPLTLRFGVRGLRGLPVHVEVRDEDGTWQRLEATSSRRLTIERPGAHLIGPSTVRVRDDLGLFDRHLRAGDPAVVLVLPAPADVGIQPHPQGADPGGDPEPDGLQPYSRGTPVGRIHWPSVARAGEWQERRVVTAPRGMPLVVVDLTGAPTDEAIDWALRAAAGQIHGLARAGGCRVLLPGERLPIPVENVAEGWPTVHRRLAGLRGVADVPAATVPAGAVHVRAAHAPPLDRTRTRRLPPEVVPLEESTYGDGALHR
ncbi:MAG TPA: DUF58 domain-containing protein [Solirubrobacterales bacterium]|jgi:uncharacterized protein (DUF58 family)|nr:DUF58 domain-containing protein [Solirubrobacterales bacterium]